MKKLKLVFIIVIAALKVGWAQDCILILQPNGATGIDALVSSYSGQENSNYGNSPEFNAMAWTNGSFFLYRSFIRFDLSSIPANAIISQATLTLYNDPASSNGNPMGEHSSLTGSNAGWLQKVNSAWYEDSITWNNQPVATTVNQVALPQSINPHQDYDIDVTFQIQDMVTNPVSNFGFMVRLQTESIYRCLLFASSDNADSANWPKLTISYSFTPAITAAGPTIFCNGGNVQLNTGFFPGLTYQWKLNGTDIPGATGPAFIANVSGSYTVTTTTFKDCASTSSPLTVTVNNLPSAMITPSGPTTFCSGGSVVLNAVVAANRMYQWKKNGIDIPGATLPGYTVTTGGTYKVTVTNTITGCSKTSAAGTKVTVNAKPAATITPQGPTTFCAGGSVVLAANTGTGLTYKWKKNNIFISGATLLNYTATTAGTYRVEVTNSNGCTKLSSGVTVTVPCKLNESVQMDSFGESAFDVKVFPNPNPGEFTIKFSAKPISPIQIELTDEIGKVVKRFETIDKTVVMKETNLAKGIYCLIARNNNEVIIKKINVVK